MYTAVDIEKYLSGKLSPAQMHTMEKAALDDPFLAEAIEGFETMKGKGWNNELAAVHALLQKKGNVAKVIPLHKSKNNWWKKAVAAVLLLGAGTTATYIFTRNSDESESNNPQVAKVIPPAIDSSKENINAPSVTASVNPTASDTKEGLPKNGDIIAKVEKPETKPGNKLYVAEAQVKPVPAGAVAVVEDKEPNKSTVMAPPPPPPGVISQNDDNNNAMMAEDILSGRNKAAKASGTAFETDKRKDQTNNIFKKETNLNNFFTTQIVGADNAPLPFSNISIKKDNFGTYADAKGVVRLVSTDSILNIDVRSVGYLPKTITLRNSQPQAKIVLQEDAFAYREKTVIGNTSSAVTQKSRRATLVIDTVVNVEPADGWENYNTYVANNLDIPDEMLKRDIPGEVELTFDVKKNGTISNIRVNKSLGAAYDEAAKRLLLEGPQWKVKKGKKTSASVKVQF